MEKTIVAAALGECVHVSGIIHFLQLAESCGWKTVFLGPAVPIEKVIQAAMQEEASLVGVSYRLTPETAERLLADFAEAADELHQQGVSFAFGGTPPVVAKIQKLSFFEKFFIGGEPEDQVLAYLKGGPSTYQKIVQYPQTTVERILWKSPYPLIRHHFGLPDLEDTRQGIEEIARAKIVDVISLGIDQEAQQNFFNPEKQNLKRKGAGGVPVRTEEDYESLFRASRQGNYPLIRTYSGTDNFIKLAEMYLKTIHIAWCAIPLFWFNQMDGRGPWDLEGSIREHQKLMAWYGQRNIPVELNEPHHWGLRDASDVVFVVSAYLAAYNARAFGVRDYIAQFMFNSPPGLSDAMDLAKMIAVIRMIEPLSGSNFHTWTQTRTGLLSYPLDPSEAQAHLAASVYLQMALKPNIIHVVGYSEADHAANPQDVIESCKMANQVIENALKGAPDMTCDPRIQARVDELEKEAWVTLSAIRNLSRNSTSDPFLDAEVLTKAVILGILDAPQLLNNPFARGIIKTRIIKGTSQAIDSNRNPISEKDRLTELKLHG
jgi:methylmalonyl-CoA mutase cobalamin-binding subunit